MTSEHQFSVGDIVHFLLSGRYDYRASGEYRIVRHMPNEGTHPQYRVRSDLEKFDRTAYEWQLGATASQPQ